MVETHRRRHLAYLMADQGGLVGNPDAVPNLPKQHLNRYIQFTEFNYTDLIINLIRIFKII